ncbi:transporter substrate-binding domain-containing protein [Lacimicrobium sp. SS2-24]|uniref:substrate-binding periplasmic protein n=1 Tax=Lacimicrobium sp. SS2-24 TaxID=2005569 RepID=UPI000B4C1150|nr:transporter substrate-binding domain-containing protein [Lacimicrobium sp. SS2-24]
MKFVTLSLLLCLGWMSHTATAERLLFVAEDLPPYHFINQQGEKDGALYEIVKAMIEQSDIQADVHFTPWARAYDMSLTQSDVIMISVLKTPVRQKQFQWIGEIYRSEAFFVKLKRRQDVQVDSLAQARHYVVGTIRGYGAEQYLRRNGFSETRQNLALSVEYHQLWGMLFKGRIDLLFTNTIGLEVEVPKAGFDPDKVEKAYAVVDFPDELHLATGLKTSPKVVKRLSEALSRLKESGRYHAILRRWGLTVSANAGAQTEAINTARLGAG